MFGICKHTTDFRISTQVISFVISTICVAERVGTDIHRSYLIIGSRYIADKNIRATYILRDYI